MTDSRLFIRLADFGKLSDRSYNFEIPFRSTGGGGVKEAMKLNIHKLESGRGVIRMAKECWGMKTCFASNTFYEGGTRRGCIWLHELCCSESSILHHSGVPTPNA